MSSGVHPLNYEMKMVDVGGKKEVLREAEAIGRLKLRKETLNMITQGKVEKGDVFSAAQLAAVLAVKKTPELIPLCHPIPVDHVETKIEVLRDEIVVEVKVTSVAKTGVEMEALTGVSTALLTVWDMVKKYEKDNMGQYPETEIKSIKVIRKVKRE